MNALLRILAALAIPVCVCLGEDQHMNLGELRTNCLAEIERGLFTDLKGIKVLDFKVLAWYRIRDSRPWYVDNALCWCKASTDRGARWVLVHMARNPDPTRSQWRSADPAWHGYFVFDVPNGWFLYFDHPPGTRMSIVGWSGSNSRSKRSGRCTIPVSCGRLGRLRWAKSLGRNSPTSRCSEREPAAVKARPPDAAFKCDLSHPGADAV